MKPILLALAITFSVSPAAAREVKQANALYEFSYSYPAAVDAHPVLRARLEADLAQRLAKLKADARTGQAEAKAGKFPFHAIRGSRAGRW
jgi:hypothetical protein